jgi:hypothetical protein
MVDTSGNEEHSREVKDRMRKMKVRRTFAININEM